MIETSNAVITGASLCIEDHGFLSSFIYLDYGGSGQGFGGYALATPKELTLELVNPNGAGVWIYRVLQIAGVEEWDKLKGRTIRARHEHNKVHAIGHIIRDDWFTPAEVFEKMRLNK